MKRLLGRMALVLVIVVANRLIRRFVRRQEALVEKPVFHHHSVRWHRFGDGRAIYDHWWHTHSTRLFLHPLDWDRAHPGQPPR